MALPTPAGPERRLSRDAVADALGLGHSSAISRCLSIIKNFAARQACALLNDSLLSDYHIREAGMRHYLSIAVFAGLLAGSTVAAQAQDEAHLRQALEGQRVTLAIDMPASTDGVDIYPGTSRPVDFQKYGGRLKKYGAAIKSGESALITRVKVRGDHIEIQLDGGGYGSFGDALDNLGNSAGTDSGTAHQAKLANDRATRLAAGSRFNIQYPNDVTPDVLTAESVVQALREYAAFSESFMAALAPAEPSNSVAAGSSRSGQTPAAIKKGMSLSDIELIAGKPVASSSTGNVVTNRYSTASGNVEVDYFNEIAVAVRSIGSQSAGTLHKGMSQAEVEALAGQAVATKTQDQVVTKTYNWRDGTLEADYFNGILVGYRISSR